ncbi:MAG: hypothetical protein H0X40_12955 [Chthoniobacterales bacterium]|nr:hypothetical protein [Chthoniobacterales bacterium]
MKKLTLSLLIIPAFVVALSSCTTVVKEPTATTTTHTESAVTRTPTETSTTVTRQSTGGY